MCVHRTVSCAKRLNRSRYRLGYGLGWGPRKRIKRGSDPLYKGAIFRGKDMPGHMWRHSAVSCAKWLNRPTCRLGCQLGWVEWSMFVEGEVGATLRIRLNRPCARMRPYDKFYFDHLFFLLIQYISLEDFCTVWLFPNHVSVGGLPIIGLDRSRSRYRLNQTPFLVW